MAITSESVGDAARFLPFDDLAAGLATLAPAPTDRGSVRLLVRRREHGRRESPDRVLLTAEGGVVGDAWSERGVPDPAGQIAVMQSDIARLIANGQPLELFGDNLFLDLDLSTANLPPDSRVRVGAATLAITPKAHNGCHKFRARFGDEALRFVASPTLRPRNFRGIYMRVVAPGEIAVGDPVEVLARAR
jgi:MOSC domain-containing protein YiiM